MCVGVYDIDSPTQDLKILFKRNQWKFRGCLVLLFCLSLERGIKRKNKTKQNMINFKFIFDFVCKASSKDLAPHLMIVSWFEGELMS